MKRLAWFAAVVLATVTGVVLLWQIRAGVVLFLFSLVVAAAVRPPINYLAGRGLPRGLATSAVYLASVAVIGGLLFLAVGRGIAELQQAGDASAATYARLKAQAPGAGALGLLASNLPPMEAIFGAVTSAQGTTILSDALGFTMSLFDAITKVLVVLVLSLYWGSDQVRFERLWLSLLPAEQRGRARGIWRSIETGVGAYVRSEVIQGILAGLALALGFTLLRLPAPTLLALIGALAWFVPLLGGALSLLLAVTAAAFHGPAAAAGAAVWTLAVFLTLELVVERRFFDRRRYSAILTVMVMIALADALGITGLLMAPPLAAAIQIFYREIVAQPLASAATSERAAPQLAHIGERLARVREAMSNVDGPAPELSSLTQRLENLVAQAGDTIEAEQHPTPWRGFARLQAPHEGVGRGRQPG